MRRRGIPNTEIPPFVAYHPSGSVSSGSASLRAIELVAAAALLRRLYTKTSGRDEVSVQRAETVASWIVLAGIGVTFLLGWWWIDAVSALGLVYFVAHDDLPCSL